MYGATFDESYLLKHPKDIRVRFGIYASSKTAHSRSEWAVFLSQCLHVVSVATGQYILLDVPGWHSNEAHGRYEVSLHPDADDNLTGKVGGFVKNNP
jgi:hypothetical protein